MSCERGFVKNSVCAAKSGISKMASKSASVAGAVGGFYKDQMNRRVETAKKVGQAYVDQTKKNASAIAGAARNPRGFYKEQFAMNYAAAAVLPSAIRRFASDAGHARRIRNEKLREPAMKLGRAYDRLNKEVEGARPNTVSGMAGAATVGVLAQMGYRPLLEGSLNGLGMDSQAAKAIGTVGSVVVGGFAAGSVGNASDINRWDAYLKRHAGDEDVEAYKGARNEFGLAKKEADSTYKKDILSMARGIGRDVRDARSVARARIRAGNQD